MKLAIRFGVIAVLTAAFAAGPALLAQTAPTLPPASQAAWNSLAASLALSHPTVDIQTVAQPHQHIVCHILSADSASITCRHNGTPLTFNPQDIATLALRGRHHFSRLTLPLVIVAAVVLAAIPFDPAGPIAAAALVVAYIIARIHPEDTVVWSHP